MGLAYTIMAARKAAVMLDRVVLVMSRGDCAYELPCRLYRLTGLMDSVDASGSARRIGTAGVSARQDYALALEDAAADVEPGDLFVHPHTQTPCQVQDIRIITAEGLVCAKTAIARQMDGEA